MKRFIIAIVALAVLIVYASAQQLTVVQPPTVYPTITFANLPAASANTGRIYNVSDVGVNGSLWQSNGTKWAPLNGTILLGLASIPYVSMSSGSIAANGALSGFTNFGATLPNAWLYLPANAVAASSPAGWYYTAFSSTSAGTVYLNQPATLDAPIPTSLTPVTDGQGAYTGVTSAVNTPAISMPAHTMGPNGKLLVSMVVTSSANNANTKTLAYTMNGSSAVSSISCANLFTNSGLVMAVNNGVENVQRTLTVAANVSGSPTNNASTVDTGAAWSLTFNIAKGTATDNVFMESGTFTLLNDGQ